MDDTSLVTESGQAKHCQAQLTRLQSALGLKDEMDNPGLESNYGQMLPAVEPDKPTNFSHKGDIVLASLDIRVGEENSKITYIRWYLHTLDTAALDKASPKDYVQTMQRSRIFGGGWSSQTEMKEHNLGGIRRAIHDALEPMCLDHCGNSEHQNEQSRRFQSNNQICNPKRDLCDDPAHETDRNSYDHTLHTLCKPRRNIILLLPEREESLRRLQMLGCDPHKHLHIVDIISLDELYQAFLVRGDYSRRNPMTGNHRTELSHNWEDMSTADQIYTSLGHNSLEVFNGRGKRSFANLKSAVDIACRDALSSNWLRTLEQIEGGAFPGPWLKLHSRNEAEAFLIEYDVARASPISYNNMKVQVKALIESLRLLSPTAVDALIGQIARTHNYTYLLDNDATTGSPNSSVANFQVPGAAQNQVEAPDAAATSPPISPRPTAVESATPFMALSPTLPPLPLGAELDEEMQEYYEQYHRDQEFFEKFIFYTYIPWQDEKEYKGLFDWEPYIDRNGRSKVRPITCDNYPSVFAILDRQPGWVMGPKLAKSLRGAISNHEEVQKWYQRLPVIDPRRGKDGGHQNFTMYSKRARLCC